MPSVTPCQNCDSSGVTFGPAWLKSPVFRNTRFALVQIWPILTDPDLLCMLETVLTSEAHDLLFSYQAFLDGAAQWEQQCEPQ